MYDMEFLTAVVEEARADDATTDWVGDHSIGGVFPEYFENLIGRYGSVGCSEKVEGRGGVQTLVLLAHLVFSDFKVYVEEEVKKGSKVPDPEKHHIGALLKLLRAQTDSNIPDKAYDWREGVFGVFAMFIAHSETKVRIF